jgi:hypothetical protein
MKLVGLTKMCLKAIYSRVSIGKQLSDAFPSQNSLKQGDASSLTFCYAIEKVQENQVRLKLNGAHQLLASADNVNPLGDNINIIKKKHRNSN